MLDRREPQLVRRRRDEVGEDEDECARRDGARVRRECSTERSSQSGGPPYSDDQSRSSRSSISFRSPFG